MEFIMLILRLFSTAIVLIYYSKGSLLQGKTLECCHDEVFNPTCEDNEVIIMQAALYGHIRLGRCLDTDVGYFGCFSDELSAMDKKCSGKRMCTVDFIDSDMEGEFSCAIPKSMARYLEASFICQQVYQPQTQRCTHQEKVKVSSRSTFLSSVVTSHTGCGEETKPWVLEAKEGQKINISLLDFNWKLPSRENTNVKCPVKYGYLVDVESNDVISLCGGIVRERTLYISQGRAVQVAIDGSLLEDITFLIGYKAVGCPTFRKPPDTWMKEEEDHILVGCVSSSDQWRMRCIGTHWLGPQRDCTKYKESAEQIQAASSVSKENNILGMPPAIAYTLFGGLFLIVISITATIVVGLFCIRKPKSQHKSEYYLAPMPVSIAVPGENDEFPTYKSVQVKLPKKRSAQVNVEYKNTMDLLGQDTMSSCGSVGRPATMRDSPHYYLLEGRDINETEPLYDVVYQTSENNA